MSDSDKENHEIICLDTNIINHAIELNQIQLLTEAFAGRILCVSTDVVNELDATTDLNRRRCLISTYNTIISKAHDTRVFWKWGDTLTKEHETFVRGETITLYTMTTALEGILRKQLGNPTDIGTQDAHQQARAERKEKRIEAKEGIEEMWDQWEQFKDHNYTLENYLSNKVIETHTRHLIQLLDRGGVHPDPAYVDAVVRLKRPLYLGQGTLALWDVAITKRYSKKLKVGKDVYDDLNIMYGAFYADTILSNDEESGFRDIFNQAAEIIGSPARAKSLEQWLDERFVLQSTR